jgi:hypothetical protein
MAQNDYLVTMAQSDLAVWFKRSALIKLFSLTWLTA